MIDELRGQTKGSVMAYLKDLSQNQKLYSNTSKGLEPLLQNHEVYIYANLNEVVLVALDPRSSRMAELADEEPFNDEHPLWFTDRDHRESPVWKLAVTCEMIRERLRRLSHHAPEVWGVLLTGCEIINFDDMVDVWKNLKITVFDRISGLSEHHFPVNADVGFPAAVSMSFVFEGSYSPANVEDAERKLRRVMEDVCETPSKPTIFNFDDDDFDTDFDKDEDESDDYNLNDAVHDEESTLQSRLKQVVHNRRQKKMDLMNKISSIALKVSTDERQPVYASGSFIVTLTATKGEYFQLDHFKCFVYTEDFHGMCNSVEGSEVKRTKGSRLSIDMSSSSIWLPGRYFMLLSDECGMLLRIDFTLDENLCATVGERTNCMPCSQEDILISCLEGKVMNWLHLTLFPGAAQFRQWVIRRTQLDVYNAYRCSLHGQEIGFNSNLLIYRRNDDINERILHILYDLSAIKNHTFKYVDCAQLYDASRPAPYEPMNAELECVSRQVICLVNLATLLNAGGKIIVRRVMDLVFDKGSDNILWLCGMHQEVDALLEMYPSLGNLFLRDNRLEQQPYHAFDLVQAFRRRLMKEFLFLPVEIMDALARAVMQGCTKQLLANWSLGTINRHVVEEVCPHYLQHALSNILSEDLAVPSVDDLCLDRLTTGSSSFEESMRELNQMIGLDSVKDGIRTMANNARLFLERHRRGLRTSEDMVFHCVFTGNPGTGKTTVAKMLGRIYHSLGLLSKGDVVSVDRTRLVGQYIGQTEDNVKVVLEEARGNVLFIDEAYTLFVGGDDRKDFGLRVIESLMTVLSQPNPDMLIVFAGYPKEMEALLSTNPGLSGRFPYRYLFPDYNAEQLMEIARRLLTRDDYILTDEAEAVFLEVIKDTLQKHPKNFSNARWITHMVKNGIIPSLADRVFSTGSEDFQTIEAADIRTAYEKLTPKTVEQEQKPGHKKVAGFCA